MMQLSVFTYFVVLLVEKVGFTPVTAGSTFSIMHLGGTVGRPLLGWISDQLLPARQLLSLVGFCIFFCGLALSSLNDIWSYPAILVLSALTGVVVAGWNGVYISEIARVMHPSRVGRATGGVSAFTFLGVAIGPALFSGILELSESYSIAFVTLGVLALGPAIMLLFPRSCKKNQYRYKS
tara:strand:+ start:184 stop:723 length:540 start_codon:yes stop_codon:yes gene_type:complete